MNRIFFIFFYLMLFLPAISQSTWFPAGAKWYYGFSSILGPGLTTLEVLEEDTLIDNLNFNKIVSTTIITISPDSFRTIVEMLYAREENKVVTGYHRILGHKLLYDFNAVVGDTLDIIFGGISPDPTIIDSIGEVEINGNQLSFQDLRFPNLIKSITINMRFVEIIGSINSHLFHSYTVFQPFDAPLYYVRCYEDENLGLIKLTNKVDCDYLPGTTAIENPTLEAISVFPNPASNIITVKVDNTIASYLVVGMQGNPQLSGTPDQPAGFEIDITNLSKGMYFLIGKDRFGNTSFIEKFIKSQDDGN